METAPRSSPSLRESNLDSATYQAALRVAYLVHLLQARSQTAPSITKTASSADNRKSTTDSWTGALYSLSDIFGRDAKTKEVRFPKDFVKVFGDRLKAVVMQQDRSRGDVYKTDPFFQRTCGAFYGSYTNPTYQRQLKENRKVEELIIAFVTSATGVLKKALPGDEWKPQLMSQVGLFVQLVRDGLREVKHVPTELTARLDIYLSTLAPAQKEAAAALQPPTVDPSIRSPSPSGSVNDMVLVRQVAIIFGVPEDQLQRDISAIKRFCTEKAALRDLKTCLSNVDAGKPFPGRREDFDSDDAFATWRRTERSTIQQLILALASANREALSDESSKRDSTISNGSFGRQSIGGSIDDSLLSPSTITSVDVGDDFTFVPSDPRSVYERLLEVCLDHDLEALKHLAPDQEVSLRILSKSHQDLLFECALRWRLMHPMRATAFTTEISKRFATGEVPIVQCVTEALIDLNRLVDLPDDAGWPYDRWAVRDRVALHHTLSELYDTLLRRIYDAVQIADDVDLPDDRDELAALQLALEAVHLNPVFVEFCAKDEADRIRELGSAINALAGHHYVIRRDSAPPPRTANEHVTELLALASWLRAVVSKLSRRFGQEAMLDGQIDVLGWYVGGTATMLAEDMRAAEPAVHALLAPDQPPDAENDVRSLYDAATELVKMNDAFTPSTPLRIDFDWMEPYVRKWLVATDAKTLEWVQSALHIDTFEPEGTDRHSSSIIDVISSCRGAVNFLLKLNWPDPVANALFMTRLSQTISKAVEQYCGKIETLFLSEMFATDQPLSADADERRSIWLQKARGLFADSKTVQPFAFQPASLVKLNNIESARDLLDKMYTAVDADSVMQVTRDQERTARARPAAPTRYLFTVKIVLAEGLVSRAGSTRLDPFLTLSDRAGRRIAKTRTVYDTAEPRWSETFDISVEGSLWLAATVYDRKLVDEHELVGRTLIHLDPRAYGDFLPHELWLNLDTHGRLLVRISMEGEKDDIQFFFGRAFRSLKRTETDMVRIIVDKMSPLIRQFLSSSVLKSLVKKGGYGFDKQLDVLQRKLKDIRLADQFKDIKLDKISSLFGSSSNTSEIPPIREEEPVLAPDASPIDSRRKASGLTDAEIEQAIDLLFEYFEQTLALLKGTLNDATFATVSRKIWKEILNVIEALIVPPLSDQPADMKQLSDKELYIVVRWLKGLSSFFYADGEGVPLEDLHTPRFRQLIGVPLYYDMGTDQLMMECNRAVNAQLGVGAGGHSGGTMIGRRITRSKSVYSQRNLGTIRQRRREKQQAPADAGAAEFMMRILRMRSGTQDFLAQQLTTLSQIQNAQSAPARPAHRRGNSDLLRASDLQRPKLPSRLTAVPPVAGPRTAGSNLQQRDEQRLSGPRSAGPSLGGVQLFDGPVQRRA